jgi:hypothetical protein
MAKNDLWIRAGTHLAQAPPLTITSAVVDFIINMARPAVNPVLSYRDLKFIINMDQTPVFFPCIPPSQSIRLALAPSTSVLRRMERNAQPSQCVSPPVVIIPSLIIFKGKLYC